MTYLLELLTVVVWLVVAVSFCPCDGKKRAVEVGLHEATSCHQYWPVEHTNLQKKQILSVRRRVINTGL
jgi:hypothetical protein